jgi:Na+/phosphate symporter
VAGYVIYKMAKLFLLLVILAFVGFFFRQFVEALFITTLIVFVVFFFLGLVFIFQGIQSHDTMQLIGGLAMSVFSASYVLVSYLQLKNKDKG